MGSWLVRAQPRGSSPGTHQSSLVRGELRRYRGAGSPVGSALHCAVCARHGRGLCPSRGLYLYLFYLF